jgi:hypothetical protein
VQYYFPALDDLFVAAIRRATDRNLGRLAEALESRPEQPLRVLWEYSRDEASTALMMEFMALGNHRKSILSEIADATNRVRQVQLDALVKYWSQHGENGDDPSPAAMRFFYPCHQFRASNGDPIYAQRPVQIGPLISRSVSGGGTFTGEIQAKVIVVDNLLDTDAFPWQADWYAARVEAALARRGFRDNFRVWYNDNADQLGPRTPRLVDYNGVLRQALRDVSAWAEHGIAPPPSTRYDVSDSQVSVPANAAARRGIQPVVDLTVRGPGHDRVDVAAGQSVTFKAKIQVPPNTGQVVATEWDFTGTGNFVAARFGRPKPTVHVQATFTYTTPGTYYVALRATSQRNGDPTTRFTRIQNLGRRRVVVHEG